MVICGGRCEWGLLVQFSLFPTISFEDCCGGGLQECFCNTSENFTFHGEHTQLLICFIFTSCASVNCNSVDFNELHEVVKFWWPGEAVVWFSFAELTSYHVGFGCCSEQAANFSGVEMEELPWTVFWTWNLHQKCFKNSLFSVLTICKDTISVSGGIFLTLSSCTFCNVGESFLWASTHTSGMDLAYRSFL